MAVTGIALCVIVMQLSISIMSGFRKEISDKISGFESQITVQARSLTGEEPAYITGEVLERIKTYLPAEASARLSVQQPAIMKSSVDFAGVIAKGAIEHDTDFTRRNLAEGVVPDYSADSTLYHILISRISADRLGLGIGDKVDTYFMGSDAYRVRRLKVAGIYDTHFSDYDRNIIYTSPKMLRGVLSMPDDAGMTIAINGLRDDEAIDLASSRINAAAIDYYYSNPAEPPLAVSNIHQAAALYFNWLALLDTNVIVILSLMGLLSALTLISSLFIIVLRRVKMIGVLKALGASNRLLRDTFTLLTLKILLIGLLIGDVISIGVILLQRQTALIPLEPEAYYLDHVPMALDWGAIALLNIAVIAISFMVLLLPSVIISTIPPTSAINYE